MDRMIGNAWVVLIIAVLIEPAMVAAVTFGEWIARRWRR
jgi:hypothetical protein